MPCRSVPFFCLIIFLLQACLLAICNNMFLLTLTWTKCCLCSWMPVGALQSKFLNAITLQQELKVVLQYVISLLRGHFSVVLFLLLILNKILRVNVSSFTCLIYSMLLLLFSSCVLQSLRGNAQIFGSISITVGRQTKIFLE